MLRPSAIRVASRYLSAGTVKVEVIDQATEKARNRFGQGIGIGRFKSPIKLYRVFDGEELREILDTGEIKGGDYSVPGERAFGAQWGADQAQVAKWGERQRGKRLGHELFMAEIDGNGRVFSHLSGADGKMQPGAGTIDLDPTFCSTGLGCSVPIRTNSVTGWYVVEGGIPTKTSMRDLMQVSSTVGLKPKDQDLFKGALISNLPRKVERAVRWEILNDMPDYRKARMDSDYRAMREMEEDWGVVARDKMDGAKLGSQLIKALCREVECGEWGTSYSRAERASGRGDGMHTFSVLVALMEVHAPATFRSVDLRELAVEGGTVVKVKFVDVRRPDGRWARVWQPWGDGRMYLNDRGNLVMVR